MTQPINKLKTSPLSRRLSIAKTSLNIGKNWAKSSVGGLFMTQEQKDAAKHTLLQEQADYLVSELGKLKGSVVKIGQMLALYGEHFLPKEVINALHTLDANTAPLSWHIIYDALKHELGERVHDFEIERTPIGTASLAQVHRAVHKYSGRTVVFKVQYPNVADAIDSDLAMFKQLLKITNAVPQTKALDDWFLEIKELLHTEVDYRTEADTTKRFASRLASDTRYIVPTIYDNYSTDRLICMSFEAGVPLNDPSLATLSQERRNALGQAAIEIVIKELFEWGEMQTDPNFGNYLVRTDDDGMDRLVLLDFGAVRRFDEHLLSIAKRLLSAGYHQDKALMKSAMTGYEFFDRLTGKPKDDMAAVFLLACEPFAHHSLIEQRYLDDAGRYLWADSQLYHRVMACARDGMTSLEFSLPPKEMMFISRKFIGAYALLVALDARTDSDALIKPYIQ
ncbi:AarF/ABC1/UbiB kinase family protein [Moraxella nasibovis]|uniref:ABC1 kinase family protein n=1 Tax=Moraxella nasibovis TaxID=2904120 RepID=UPI0024105FD4|nr:AarF/ABC1/UbiB kinase family protein [Moraxella nasibovis]WFF39438.1 AarF/ABC1/UbiB kinase family protein [Moraxella nasibovis]